MPARALEQNRPDILERRRTLPTVISISIPHGSSSSTVPNN
jgi:hypothetical protein